MKSKTFLRIAECCLLAIMAVKANASAQFDQLNNLDAGFLPTWVGSFFPAQFAFVPILIFIVSMLVLVWSKQTLVMPFILLVIFLASFNFVLPELGFLQGSWIFYGIAILATTLLFVKIFWRD